MPGMRYQPQQRPILANSGPLTQGLAFVALPGLRTTLPYNVATSRGVSESVATPKGIAYPIFSGANVPAYPHNPDLNLNGTDFTVLVFLDQIGNVSGYKGILGKRNSSTGNGIWSMGTYPNGILVFSGNNVDRQLGKINISDRQGAMYVVTGSVKDALVRAYQDGQAIGSGALPTYLAGNTGDLRIGTFRGDSLSENFTGNYNMVAIWRRQLSASEIKAIYDNPWQLFEVAGHDYDDEGFKKLFISTVGKSIGVSNVNAGAVTVVRTAGKSSGWSVVSATAEYDENAGKQYVDFTAKVVGVSSASAHATAVTSATGASTGSSIVAAKLQSLVDALGRAYGNAVADGSSSAVFQAKGQSTGGSDANATTVTIYESTATSLSTSTVQAVAEIVTEIMASSKGFATVSGITRDGMHYTAAGDRFNIRILFSEYVVSVNSKEYNIKFN